MSLRGSPMLMKNDGGASFSLQRRLQPTVFALTEFRRMCGEAWAVLQGSGFFAHSQHPYNLLAPPLSPALGVLPPVALH